MLTTLSKHPAIFIYNLQTPASSNTYSSCAISSQAVLYLSNFTTFIFKPFIITKIYVVDCMHEKITKSTH